MSDPTNESSVDEGWETEAEESAPTEPNQEVSEQRPDRAQAQGAVDGMEVEANRETRAARGGRSNANGGTRKRRRRRRNDDYRPDDDARALDALNFVSDVVRQMDMDCKVRLRRPKEDDSRQEIRLEIVGRDAGRVIGKKGQVLAALQFLVHRVVNRPGLERRPIVVDAEGYRSRRDNSLASMARRLGKQAVDEGKIITFEPMNPRDRRVIHLALAKFQGVITKSEGEGDSRRVQIIPVRRQD
jgi:spoIIIJ-associated protein